LLALGADRLCNAGQRANDRTGAVIGGDIGEGCPERVLDCVTPQSQADVQTDLVALGAHRDEQRYRGLLD
jgi:hypothetical protein